VIIPYIHTVYFEHAHPSIMFPLPPPFLIFDTHSHFQVLRGEPMQISSNMYIGNTWKIADEL
jgi:hypothetical protein